MRYKYYVPKEQASEIEKLNLGPKTKSRFGMILKSSTDDYLESLGLGYYKTEIKIHGRPTIIWFIEETDNLRLCVLREFFTNHDDYDLKVTEGTKKRWPRMFAYSPSEKEEVMQLIETLKNEKEDIPVIELPVFTVSELSFLNDKSKINHDIFDETIYETLEWINLVQGKNFNDYDKVAISLKDYIYEHCTDDYCGYISIPIQLKDESCILVNKQHSGNKGIWILMGIIKKGEHEEYHKDFETLLRDCRRAYPYTTLEDPDFFRNMEKDPNSNFILSPEEAEIVASQNVYPLFISGRAGSGKSTVLQYLFAEIVLRYLVHRNGDELKSPIYLSYSSSLVKNAESLLKSLFGTNNIYREELKKVNISYEENIEPILGSFLSVFQDLVKKCISLGNPQVLNQRFSRSKYLPYSRFRQEWQKRFGNLPEAIKNYGPSISWHVIRTYIKGWNSQIYLSPEEYAQIGRDNQDVTDEAFRMVYEKVWLDWYSDVDFWDDQDIVRYCLHPDDCLAETFANEMFSAIFCDEAQDFTRVEIDFILKISSFSNRKCYNASDIQTLPFVFAGDEFQTLNPTGFSWDSLKSYFTKRLAEISGFSEKEISPKDPIPLKKNYRSTAQIVKLGNHIQFLREARFGQRSTPQDPYYSDEGEPVYCLSKNNPHVWDKLKEEKVVLIVPSADGQTPKDYFKGTDIGDKISFYEDGTAKNITILNPAQAKGLEYQNVAIYGFNCLSPYQGLSIANLCKWFDVKSKETDLDDDISLKYQVNNAYVAVTRAKKKLFIIDTFDGSSFWAFSFSGQGALDEDVIRLNSCMKEQLSIKRQKIWESQKMGWVIEGDIDKITGENIQTFKENTVALEKQGRELRDPMLMRSAAARYRERGETPKYNECQAYAYTFDPEPDYLSAANAFLAADKTDKAISYYWIALDECASSQDEIIIKNLAKLSERSSRDEVEVCKTALQTSVPIKTINRYLLLLSEKSEIEQPLAWEKILRILIQKAKELNNQDFQTLIQYRKRLKSQITIDSSQLIRIAFLFKLYKEVIALCDEDRVKPQEYYKSKERTLKYPESIVYLEGTGDKEWKKKILALYHANSSLKIEPRYMSLIGQCAQDLMETSVLSAMLPAMLSCSQRKDSCESILESAIGCGIKINKDVLQAIIDVRYSALEAWFVPDKMYSSQQAKTLFKIVEEVKKLQTEEGRDNLLQQVKNKNIKSFFSDTYGKYARTPFISILLSELSIQMEQRGTFIDAVRFYEWAKNQTDDPYVKQQMDIRWISCKERMADKDQIGTHLSDSLKKRNEIGIPLDEKIPLTPDVEKICNWESMFEAACKIGSEITVKTEAKDNVQEESRKIVNGEQRQDRSRKLQRFTIAGYEFRYSFSKQELSITYVDDEDDYSIKIRGGVIPSDADFVFSNTNRMITVSGEETPFSLYLEDNKIVVELYDGDNPSGIKLSFEF